MQRVGLDDQVADPGIVREIDGDGWWQAGLTPAAVQDLPYGGQMGRAGFQGLGDAAVKGVGAVLIEKFEQAAGESAEPACLATIRNAGGDN